MTEKHRDEQDASCRQAHARNEERYNRQPCPLPQLRIGTQVRWQNPVIKKWNRVGVIIGIGRHRDSHVKLPSGRWYWRNCRFMKPETAQSDRTVFVSTTMLTLMLFSGRLSFHRHYYYLNSYTGFQILIELILSCPLLYISCSIYTTTVLLG